MPFTHRLIVSHKKDVIERLGTISTDKTTRMILLSSRADGLFVDNEVSALGTLEIGGLQIVALAVGNIAMRKVKLVKRDRASLAREAFFVVQRGAVDSHNQAAQLLTTSSTVHALLGGGCLRLEQIHLVAKIALASSSIFFSLTSSALRLAACTLLLFLTSLCIANLVAKTLSLSFSSLAGVLKLTTTTSFIVLRFLKTNGKNFPKICFFFLFFLP